MSINVRVLYTEGCANTPPTVQLIERVAQDMGIPVEMDKVSVTSQAKLKSFGSLEAQRFRSTVKTLSLLRAI